MQPGSRVFGTRGTLQCSYSLVPRDATRGSTMCGLAPKGPAPLPAQQPRDGKVVSRCGHYMSAARCQMRVALGPPPKCATPSRVFMGDQ